MSRVALVVACAAGCGRIGFDALDIAPCGPPSATVPGHLTITGTTFSYLNFMGTRLVVGNVGVAVLDNANDVLGSGQSDAGGNYSLTFATGGRAEASRMVFTQPAYFTTTTWFDTPLDRDATGKGNLVWSPGEGPMWNTGSMGSVYGTSHTTVDSSKSTLTVTAEDCAGAPLAGVTIDVSPPPAEGEYLGANGQPAFGATETMAPAGQYVGFNAQPGPTTITAAAPGYQFAPQTVQVNAGDQVTLVEMRPLM